MFPEGKEHCVTLDGILVAGNRVGQILFNRTGRICAAESKLEAVCAAVRRVPQSAETKPLHRLLLYGCGIAQNAWTKMHKAKPGNGAGLHQTVILWCSRKSRAHWHRCEKEAYLHNNGTLLAGGMKPIIKGPLLEHVVFVCAVLCEERSCVHCFHCRLMFDGFHFSVTDTDTGWIVICVLLAVVTLAVIVTVAIIVAKRSSPKAPLEFPSAIQVTCRRKSENSGCCFGWFTVCFKPVIAVASHQ